MARSFAEKYKQLPKSTSQERQLKTVAPVHKTHDLNEQDRQVIRSFWTSKLFSDVYLSQDLPAKHKDVWENEELDGFKNFVSQIESLAIEKKLSNPEKWNETQTIDYWIKRVMEALGWSQVSGDERYIPEWTFTVTQPGGTKSSLRPDLVYVNNAEEIELLSDDRRSKDDRLLQARNDIILVLEAKYWDRLQNYQNIVDLGSNEDKKRSDVKPDSASNLGPGGQVLTYLKHLKNDVPARNHFGIVTDGKTWRLHHVDYPDSKYYEFDLGDMVSYISHGFLDDVGSRRRKVFLEASKYFYHFFSKEALFSPSGQELLLDLILKKSKKYANDIEEDLRKRFISAMTLTCNAFAGSKRLPTEQMILIRNCAESFIFNLLFIRNCEAKGVLPQSPEYRPRSLSYLFDCIDGLHRFDPQKTPSTNEQSLKESFKGDFNYSNDGSEIFKKILHLTKTIHDGDYGLKIKGFKESIFETKELTFIEKAPIPNLEMLKIIFLLGFTTPPQPIPGRRFQQIPYASFTSRQLGSLYESFLEYEIDYTDSKIEYTGSDWKTVNGLHPFSWRDFPAVS